jgi:hypothetical protein
MAWRNACFRKQKANPVYEHPHKGCWQDAEHSTPVERFQCIHRLGDASEKILVSSEIWYQP